MSKISPSRKPKSSLLKHLADLDRVQRALEGEETAVCEIQERGNPYLSTTLRERGASEHLIEEMLALLWARAFVGEKTPLLARYDGRSSLQTWLSVILTNQWYSFQRENYARSQALHAFQSLPQIPSRQWEDIDDKLKHTIDEAVRGAFAGCTSEEIVLIRLVHMYGITRREIARLLRLHESVVSRKLKAIEKKIAQTTMQTVRRIDPHLDVSWNDFLELCEGTNLLYDE